MNERKRGRAATALMTSLAAASFAFLGHAATAQTVNKDAELTIGWAEPPDSLNPATTGARDVGPIDVNIFDTLVWLTPDLKITPDLATSWSISPDGKTYSFTLRRGVTFQDGTTFNAAAVAANIDYITAKSTQSKVSLSLLGPCKTAKATGELTVAISCTTSYAPLLAQLGEPYLGIQSPAAIRKYGPDLGLHPTGTGPFSFVLYRPGQELVLKRNAAYEWDPPATGHAGPPDLAGITFQIVSNSEARVSEFQSGQSQMMQETPGIYWKALGRANRFTAIRVPIAGLGIFAPINASRWPTSDIAVRKAILYAVDKVGVLELADAGVLLPSNTPIQQGSAGYDAALENAYPYDPAKSEALLKADGWTKSGTFWEKNGKPLTLTITAISTVPAYPLLAQAIQGYLRKVGMDAHVVELAVPAWLAANIRGDMSLTPLQYIGVDPDALRLWYLPGQYFNWSHYTNPELTDLLTRGQHELDAAKRQAIYFRAQQLIMDEAVVMPINQNADLVMVSKKLAGLSWSGGGFEYLGAASLAR